MKIMEIITIVLAGFGGWFLIETVFTYARISTWLVASAF